MRGNDSELRELIKHFNGTVPLMPLEEFVFFPNTVQPFHVYNSIYIELIHHIMSKERLLAIPLYRDGAEGGNNPVRPIHEIASLGYLSQVEELEGDKCNILVTGLMRVQITEVESAFSFRRGAVTRLVNYNHVTDEETKRHSMLNRFKMLLNAPGSSAKMEMMVGEHISLEMLTHVIISALPVDVKEKQKMLELQSLELRIDILLNFLESGLSSMESLERFNPIFSTHSSWN